MVSRQSVCWEICLCSVQEGPTFWRQHAPCGSIWSLCGWLCRAVVLSLLSAVDLVWGNIMRMLSYLDPSPVADTGTFQGLAKAFLLPGTPCGVSLWGAYFLSGRWGIFLVIPPGHGGVLVGWVPGKRETRCVIRSESPAWWCHLLLLPSRPCAVWKVCSQGPWQINPVCLLGTCFKLPLSENLPNSVDFISKCIT